jgi:hypothetical protein
MHFGSAWDFFYDNPVGNGLRLWPDYLGMIFQVMPDQSQPQNRRKMIFLRIL